MIPKQLFFIWLGDNKPNYVDFAVKAFKDVNPDFKVDLMEYSTKDIINGKIDESLKESIKLIKNFILKRNENIYYNIFYKRLKKLFYLYDINSSIKFKYLGILPDFYRLFLINKYGGIYIDCDCFPIKPFDEKLLNTNFFINNIDDCRIDFNFIGCAKNNLFKENIDFYDYINKYANKSINFNHGREYFKNKERFLNLRNKFFNCKLNIGEYFTHKSLSYIEHFYDGIWLKEKKEIINKEEPILKELFEV